MFQSRSSQGIVDRPLGRGKVEVRAATNILFLPPYPSSQKTHPLPLPIQNRRFAGLS